MKNYYGDQCLANPISHSINASGTQRVLPRVEHSLRQAEQALDPGLAAVCEAKALASIVGYRLQRCANCCGSTLVSSVCNRKLSVAA